MPRPELGTKRNCPACAARFYDLDRQPIQCPKCGEQFEPEILLKPRRQRAAKVEEPKPQTAEEKEEAELKEVEDAENAEVDDDENEIKEIDLENPTISSDDDDDNGDDEPKSTDTPLEDNLTVVDENKDIISEENSGDDDEAALMDELGDDKLPEVEDEEEDPK